MQLARGWMATAGKSSNNNQSMCMKKKKEMQKQQGVATIYLCSMDTQALVSQREHVARGEQSTHEKTIFASSK